ncbi:uncharacterized protein C8Q71DRAFT_849124 [Rhodofomes roseus]|uniref:Protein kinase domain-containing protein n=1 Tax=Rhodofomes roseus TaxID=34475 RepID=A0ABQ8KBF4_9APHY|nr:uncharacterized protein C8Q71DRAFT_849124 [Rhodofomes roseus]KAH9834784.1 hypothetical protein C8Q71DRAFT_849124 [Rhodofomes roseus]
MSGDSDKEREDRFHYSNRRRKVTRQWLREPDGEPLPRPPPVGTRAPNGLIWGHTCEDLMWIQRIPKVDVLTVWSRSMIKEFGENYDEAEFDAPEPRPRVRRPWPVLRLPDTVFDKNVPPVGAYDEGSDHEDDSGSDVRWWRVRVDDPKTGKAMKDKIVDRVVIEDMDDVFVPNDGDKPVISPLGHPYAALWKQEFRKLYAAAGPTELRTRFTVIGRHGNKNGRCELADGTGLMAVIMGEYDDDEDSEPGLLIIDSNRLVHIRHDPSPVIFLNKAKNARTDGEEQAAGRETRECDGDKPGGPLEDTKESAGGAAEDQDVDVPMHVATDSSDGDSESLSRPPSESVHPDAEEEEHDIAGSSRPRLADTESLEDSKPRFAVSSPDSDEHKAFEPSGLLTEGEDTVVEETLPPDEGDEAVAEETPAEASKDYMNDDGRFKEDIIADLPKLEEFIPEEYFPDALLVHRVNHEPRKYKRVLPKFERDDIEDEPERLGTLYLNGPKLGEGHHSYVRRAPLKLPPPLSAYGKHRMVTVAAKTSFVHVSARKFLRHEAEIFSLFPRHLQEEYCGYNLVTPIKHPVPVGAIVPKFYGYYVPVESDGSAPDRKYEDHKDDDTSQGKGTSPILLMEECGEPVVPQKFSIDDRSECYSLMARLQLAEFLQGSMYVRNILWQPGPLWKPPQERSRETPSFRIIDFGRALHWEEYVSKEEDEKKRESKAKEWKDQASYDQTRIERELLIKFWDY